MTTVDARSSTTGRRAGRGGGWPGLAEQLLVEFPEAAITDVVRELRAARDAVEASALPARRRSISLRRSHATS